MNLTQRPRRLRTDPGMRDLVRETRLSKKALVYPVFVREGSNLMEEIPSLEGQKRCSPDQLPRLMEPVLKAGIRSVLLFGLPAHKDEQGSSAFDDNGVVQQAVRVLKRECPELKVITDVCLCEYTSHGHCGVSCAGKPWTTTEPSASLRRRRFRTCAPARILSPLPT